MAGCDSHGEEADRPTDALASQLEVGDAGVLQLHHVVICSRDSRDTSNALRLALESTLQADVRAGVVSATELDFLANSIKMNDS